MLLWLLLFWLALFGGFYAWKRSIIKALFLTNMVFFFLFSMFGGLVLLDVQKMKEKILTEPKLFVLRDGDITAAFTVSHME